MHQKEVLELMVVGVTVAGIVIISFFLGKWRKFGWLLAFILLLSFCVLYIARPYWIDAQIEKKVELLEPYLEQLFPNEVWTIITVPHRKAGYKHLNPYLIGVVFENEPEVTYHYSVDKNTIYQISYSTDKNFDELNYKESK
ncbi:hypothetical protein AWH56_011700 [Anaerobacillus isosaccharinicus]|uniref:DUF3139 domain-containing protein n=1 Tax=Anaerobacillus isosaccharinicus TaxID=1532552 RepID=A0A1S2M8U9_9BACI|nr:hypothetical protein [Anaerobacillus isosaccharinicus]MBA5588438.1 hypothetical protein [Anaerobacillus isosaccharinicus]QOY38134.1 hypothetical protein AWH56_011700 [Anaerobacillus isosaccharinicus]